MHARFLSSCYPVVEVSHVKSKIYAALNSVMNLNYKTAEQVKMQPVHSFCLRLSAYSIDPSEVWSDLKN